VSDPLRIEADRDRCVGAGMCVMVASRVFDQDPDDGRVQVLAEQPPATEVEAVRVAVADCPSGALSYRRDTA
jgi:ferredoxin